MVKKYMKYILAFGALAAAVLAWILFRQRNWVDIPKLKTELRAIDAESEIEKLQAELGKEKALEKIRNDHANALGLLEKEKSKEIESLKNNPSKLVRLLVRRS